MGAIATLGRAFIEVHADTSPFARQVRQAMRRLAQDMREDTDRQGDQIGERLGERVGERLSRSLRRRSQPIDFPIRITPASAAATELAIRRITRDREIDVRVNRRTLTRNLGLILTTVGTFALAFIRILGDLFNFGRQIGQIFGEAFSNLSRALGGTANASVTVGAAFAQLAASAAALVVVLILLVGVFGVLLAAASALYQALLLILVLLPGLGAATLLSIAPMVLIFSNLGDAIKATAGSADEFNSAIEGLGDNTGSVLSMLRDMVQFFIEIREEVQEDFFAPINESLKDFEQNLGPTFEAGFRRVATAAGEFAASFIDLFDHPQAERFFTDLFSLSELIIDDIGGAFVELFGSLGTLIDETFPELRRAVMGIGDLIRGWARDIEDFATDPNMRDTLREWEESFEVITELLGTAVDLALTLMDEFRDDGIPVLESLNGLMEDFIAYLESDAGREFFDGLRIAAEFVIISVGAIAAIIASIVQLIGAMDEIVRGDLNDGFNALQEGPLSLIFGLTGFILERLLGWSEAIIDAFVQLGFVRSLLILTTGPATGILGRFLGWGQRLRDAWERLGAIRSLVILLTGPVTGILGRFVNWRGILQGVRNVLRNIRDWINRVRDRVNSIIGRGRVLSGVFGGVRSVVSGIAGFLRTIINRISSAIGFARRLAGALSSIRVPSLGGLNPFGADGGIFTRPTSMIIGEAGPEVLIPLTRPARARELIAASGIGNLIRGGDGASVATIGTGTGTTLIRLVLQSDGSAAGDAIMEVLRRGVRIRGGNVQQVLGS